MTDVTEIEIQSVKHINTHLGKPLQQLCVKIRTVSTLTFFV